MSPPPLSGPLARWLPHPVLTLALTAGWLLLQNDFSAGGLVLGGLLGLLIPRLTAGFWPGRPRIRAWPRVLGYLGIVALDVVVANLQVARLILFRPVARLQTRWVSVPLALTSPEAITVLAGTLTMTPGTVSADLSSDGRHLLVHCLDAPDAEAAVLAMKTRYEARLLEIF